MIVVETQGGQHLKYVISSLCTQSSIKFYLVDLSQSEAIVSTKYIDSGADDILSYDIISLANE